MVVLAAAGLTYLFRDSILMDRLEMVNLDSWMSFQRLEVSSEIAVVEITDEEYRSLFNATSPLSPPTVAVLIRAIAHCRPKVIGVDLDTTAWPLEVREQVSNELLVIRQNGGEHKVPLVWALGGYSEAGKIEVDGLANPDPRSCFALPASVEDGDGIVRGYFPEISSDRKRWLGFAPAILRAAQGEACGAPDVTGEALTAKRVRVNFRGGRASFVHLTASTVMGAAYTPAWDNENPLRGKIVLLGGAYRAARDRYVTPLGTMSGVDIAAHAVRSASPGGEIKEVGEAVFLALDLLLGCVLVTLTFFSESPWMLVGTAVAVPVLAMTASLLAYSSFGYFASFMPVLLAVFFHALIEHVITFRRMAHELARLRSEV